MRCLMALKTRLSAQVYIVFSHSIKKQSFVYVFIYFRGRHTICRSYLLVGWLIYNLIDHRTKRNRLDYCSKPSPAKFKLILHLHINFLLYSFLFCYSHIA